MFLASAYRQLSPVEKAFTDRYVSDLEALAARSNERLSNMLMRPVQADDLRSQELLERPLVRAAIAERVKDIAQEAELSAYRTIKEVGAIAFSSIGNYMRIEPDGQPYFDMTQCTPEQLSAIKSIEIEESMKGRKFKFTLHDKMAALAMQMRYQGLLEPDNPHHRAATAKPVELMQLDASANDETAADAYSRLINA